MKKKSMIGRSERVRAVMHERSSGKLVRVKEVVRENKPLTNKSGKVRELTSKDFRAMRPASEVLPAKLLSALPRRKRGERGPQKEPTKVPVTLRYSPEVVSYFKSTGEGWQTRIDSVLKGYIKRHPTPPRNDAFKKHQKHQKHSRGVA